MKISILYHPDSEFARSVEEYATIFERERGTKIDLVSLETVEGAEMAKLYDIVRYPAVLAIADNGQIQKAWQGEMLPIKDEVAGYLHA
jgi:hypothetical protein